jgi:transcriptional antiterminator RfaH
MIQGICHDAIPRWYAIQTKPKQELRASANLHAWGIETFAPFIKRRRYRQFTDAVEFVVEPLFTSYVFGHFESEMLGKVCFTRGVKRVVSFAGVPVPIDDEIISLIQSRIDQGFVKQDLDLKHGDPVRVEGGTFKGLSGVFDRKTKGSTRVLLLLQTVSYQARVEVERIQVSKVN